MKAHIELNLNDALNPEELRQLTALAAEQKKPLERILYEAAKALATKVLPPVPSATTAAA